MLDGVALSAWNTHSNGQLEGKVLNFNDKTSIKKAKIKVYEMDSEKLIKKTTSSETGDFKLSIPEGDCIIRVSADGYIPFESVEYVKRYETKFIQPLLMVEGSENPNVLGEIGGTISDTLSGEGISDVNIQVLKGWNNSNGNVINSTETNDDGQYSLNLPYGNYTLLLSKDGYTNNHINVAVSNTPSLNQNGAMTPDDDSIPAGELRFVLTWGETPYDLDSHLIGPKVDSGLFHVYYNDKEYSYNDETQAFLDHDDRYSYGPETTTIYKMKKDGTYSFYIRNYSDCYDQNDTNLANSGAKVQVYAGNLLIETFNVPTTGIGPVWYVFDIDATSNKIIPINEFLSDFPNSYDIEAFSDEKERSQEVY